jgi:hypothetical protein
MPNARSARDAADDVQRGQAIWALLPQSLREWVIGALWFGGTTVAGRLVLIWKSYDGWQLTVGSVGLGCCVVITYAVVRSVLKTETGAQSRSKRAVDHLVRAVERGSYKGVPRRLWSEFMLDDPAHFSEVWMARVDVDASDDASTGPLPVRVRAVKDSNSWAIELHVTNDSHQAIRSARFVILDILAWDEKTRAYVETDDVHEHGSFIPRILDTHDLFPGKDVRYGVITDDDHNISLTRDREFRGSSMCCRFWSTGLQRIEYRIVDKENRELRGAICLRCYQYNPPTLVDCPNTA